ncbi:MAG: lipid II:glycine glycyltransferase FemX [Actinomycetota bacterium]
MRVIEVSPAERARFDAAVAASPLADSMQSFAWGEVKRAGGWHPLRLLVEDTSGTVRAACSILRTVPARGVPPLLYAPRGPVLDYGDTEALRALLDAIRARARGAFMFKCDPAIEAGSDAARALAGARLRPVRTGAFGGVQPTAVMVLDIDREPEKILEGFKSKWRYNIRLAERKGVKVRPGGANDLGAFYDILIETARRDGFTVRNRAYFQTLWRELGPQRQLKLFMAEFEGRPVAGILLMCMGGRAIHVYGASSDRDRNVMPNHLLQWTAIRWAHDAGYKIYDFRGVSPVRDGKAVEPHIAGLNRFKEGFGARYVEYAGEFDLPLRPGWYAIWRTLAPKAIELRKKLGGAGAAAPAE